MISDKPRQVKGVDHPGEERQRARGEDAVVEEPVHRGAGDEGRQNAPVYCGGPAVSRAASGSPLSSWNLCRVYAQLISHRFDFWLDSMCDECSLDDGFMLFA